MKKYSVLAVIGILAVGGGIVYQTSKLPDERVEHWIDLSWCDPAPNLERSGAWQLHELIVYSTPAKAAVMYEQLQGERSMNATEFLKVPPEHLFLVKLDVPKNGVFYVSFVEYQGHRTKAEPKDYQSAFAGLPMIWKGHKPIPSEVYVHTVPPRDLQKEWTWLDLLLD